MTDEWKTRILQLLYRDNEEQDFEFIGLVNMAINNCDYETCKVLMKIFVTDDDFGVQESVVSALSSAKIEDYQRALLEELPRLIIDAPEWSDVLVERELKYHFNKFRETLMMVSPKARKSLNELLERKHFLREYGDLNRDSKYPEKDLADNN